VGAAPQAVDAFRIQQLRLTTVAGLAAGPSHPFHRLPTSRMPQVFRERDDVSAV